MKNIFSFCFIIISIFFLYSCNLNKDIVYLKNAGSNNTIKGTNYNPKIKVDDLLSIQVFSSDDESVKPFNLNNQISQGGNSGYSIGSMPPIGYLVDQEGNINFPTLGLINVANKTKGDLIEYLQKLLSPYLKNPVVSIRTLNFKITVLGEVNKPGTFTIPNEKISIFEALGIAGDITISGVRKNILLIREEKGVKKQYRLDLTDVNILNSSEYYLCQNDIIYVQPNRAKSNSSVINTANTGAFISAISLIITTSLLIFK